MLRLVAFGVLGRTAAVRPASVEQHGHEVSEEATAQQLQVEEAHLLSVRSADESLAKAALTHVLAESSDVENLDEAAGASDDDCAEVGTTCSIRALATPCCDGGTCVPDNEGSTEGQCVNDQEDAVVVGNDCNVCGCENAACNPNSGNDCCNGFTCDATRNMCTKDEDSLVEDTSEESEEATEEEQVPTNERARVPTGVAQLGAKAKLGNKNNATGAGRSKADAGAAQVATETCAEAGAACDESTQDGLVCCDGSFCNQDNECEEAGNNEDALEAGESMEEQEEASSEAEEAELMDDVEESE